MKTEAYFNNNVRIRTIKRINNETDRRDDRGYRCASWGGITASARDVAALADFSHNPADQAATISSGSFRTDGMIVIPCSMKTLAGIRVGYADGLVGRAADVVLKEGRKLVLVPREMPLSTIHLENMLALSRMGVAMVPPMPAFYNHPETVDDIVHHVVARVLDQFGLEHPHARRWQGLPQVRNFSQENE